MNTSRRSLPDRRDRIIAGAGTAFLRFGFERTSMADIAESTGISRTALYHYFPNKEDVLRVVIDRLHGETLTAAEAALANATTLQGALTGLLDARIGGLLRLLATSPHAGELTEAGSRLAGPAISEADGRFVQLVTRAFERHGRPGDAGLAADTLAAAAKGLIRAPDGLVSYACFHARLGRLVAWIC